MRQDIYWGIIGHTGVNYEEGCVPINETEDVKQILTAIDIKKVDPLMFWKRYRGDIQERSTGTDISISISNAFIP